MQTQRADSLIHAKNKEKCCVYILGEILEMSIYMSIISSVHLFLKGKVWGD